MYNGSVQDGVVRISDGKFIPRSHNNPEWTAFLTWQAAGGVLGAAVVPLAKTQWFIDVGPFFDRFAGAKMNVLTSANPLAKAIVTDVMVRKWIDLHSPAVGAGIDALISINVAGVDAVLKDLIINTPVTSEESLAVRTLYFGGK
jgi:hypothetical protein